MLTTTERPRPRLAARQPPRPPRTEARLTTPSDIWATLALVLLTAAGMVGFSRVFAGHAWIGPVAACLLGVHLLCWALRRWHVPVVPALVLGAAAVWLLGLWTVLGQYTHYGLPGPAAWSHFVNTLHQASNDINASAAPVAATPGLKLLAATGAGLVALLSDAIAFRWRYVLLGAAPAFALFVVSCTSGQGRGRVGAVVALIGGVLIYLLAQRAPGGATVQVWFAGVRTRATTWTLVTGVVVGAAAVVAALAVTPLMHGTDGVGAFGWRSGTGPGGGGTRTVANPIVDLQARLLQLSNTPVFTVQSPVPSYWRLTSLDSYTGSTWTSQGSYKAFHSNLPGTRPLATRQVQERFVIQQLESVWLPSAFNPFRVEGVRDVSYDPTSNSLITSRPSSDGMTYTVTSYQYLSSLSAGDLRAAPDFSVPSQYTSLPNTVPGDVLAKATELTAGVKTEYDKALAIQDYLLHGGFTYTLQPPLDGAGNDAISTFLFSTRAGYCQQFAGAYAVLARAAGLPTRLAVGFATGTLKGGVYHVTDALAHTWPEVYFGPTYGWVPFEPTPGFPGPATGDYLGSGHDSGNAAPKSTPSTTRPGGANTTSPDTVKGGGKRSTPTTLAHGGGAAGRSHGSGPGWFVLLGLAAAVLAWLAANLGGRRLRRAMRRRRARPLGQEGEVLARWADADEVLSWVGLGRQPSETFDEYAGRVTERIGWVTTDEGLPDAVRRLAGLARQAAFAPRLPDGAAGEAARLADGIRNGVVRAAGLRQRLKWAFLPRPGYRA